MLPFFCRISLVLLLVLLPLAHAETSLAHFGMIIPDSSTVTEQKKASLSLNISFSHPAEQRGMTMLKPLAVNVVSDDKKVSLLESLKPVKTMGEDAWECEYKLGRPGVYQFYVEPQAYFEPGEDCFIIHYAKTVVAAFGAEEGWDKPLGLKTEILPLTRPFGNYVGNCFQGQVLLDGKPVPGALVEVESYNKNGKPKPVPNAYFITQTVRADANGVFTWAIPWAGWWGFAALNPASEKREYNGVPKEVELGAIIWLEFVEPESRQANASF